MLNVARAVRPPAPGVLTRNGDLSGCRCGCGITRGTCGRRPSSGRGPGGRSSKGYGSGLMGLSFLLLIGFTAAWSRAGTWWRGPSVWG